MTRSNLDRRDFLRRLAAMGVLGGASTSWLPALAQDLAAHPDRRRQCILLWMNGGPSQTDTFDMKPTHANGGEFRPIETSVPGIQMSEHLPKLSQLAHHLAIVRSLNTKEGDHDRGAYLVRTGRRPGGPVRFPCIGSALCKELSDAEADLPQYVSVGSPGALSPAAFGPGFLGPQYAAATVGVIRDDNANANPGVDNPAAPAAANDARQPPPFPRLGLDYLRSPLDRLSKRQQLWTSVQQGFLARHSANNVATQDTVYRRAMRLMQSKAAAAFDLTRESAAMRERYGRSVFGQGCLLALRLIEEGVPFVEVTLGTESPVGWDTHQENFPQVRQLCQQLDSGFSALIEDLRDRGRLETTTILWIGEFGRTPTINPMAGRDHFPNAWSCVFGGGGIAGGQVFGKTSEDGQEIVDGQVGIEQVLATLCTALGISPATENETEIGRPIKIIEGEPIQPLLA